MRQFPLTILFILICFFSFSLKGQTVSQIKEYEEEYITYPFSDPNPVPVAGKIYPYFRYDGYTIHSVIKNWKIIEMENDYLRLKIFPEIGGKIWSVYDKTTGKELFYNNKVVKFRDISLRGPWTSGGIEFNYGVIGHAPSCSFPVDYSLQQKPDGSVSCFISDFDLLTRTRWTVEINLPHDKGWFSTRSFWHNGSSATQPYYNWVNTGVKAGKDLELVYPGTYSIEHNGTTESWPLNTEYNKQISFWAENDFGGAKSYHIAGTYANYFGTFWTEEDFGMMHYSERDDKIGKKMFTWALSDDGDLWEELLTDTNGQYIEVQSGRLHNQNVVASTLTPFKQIEFVPYSTDEWMEYWYPFHGTGGVSNAGLYGVLNLTEEQDNVELNFSPLQYIKDTLKYYDSNDALFSFQPVDLAVAKPYATKVSISSGQRIQKITLCNEEIWNRDTKILDRPSETQKEFDWNTAYGNYLKGRDLAGFRLYDEAESYIRQSLTMDPNYIPALVEMSRLYYRHMDYDSAYSWAKKALSIDTYHPEANFEYGRSARILGRTYDALDGFEIAAITTPLRSAAYTEIGKIHYSNKDYTKAADYALKSLINNSYNIEGLQMLYLCYSIKNDQQKIIEITARINELDPFNLFLSFEQNYKNGILNIEAFVETVQAEMAAQQFLELAIWYYSLNMNLKSRAILENVPTDGEGKYWLAFLHKDSPDLASYLKEADKESPYFVFPFRPESEVVFEWTIINSYSWKPLYYMTLLQKFANNDQQAMTLAEKLGNEPDFSPFYALRAKLSSGGINKEDDLKKAVSLSPKEWRYTDQLTRYYLEQNEPVKALSTVRPFYNSYKEHFPTASLYARTLVYNQRYGDAEKILDNTYILPFEGERSGRVMYRGIKLMLAVQALAKGKTREAQAKIEESHLWPHHLGIGKPYDDLIDTRLEDWLSAMVAIKTKDEENKIRYLNKVATSPHRKNTIDVLLQSLALNQLGEQIQSEKMFNQWLSLQADGSVKEWGKQFYTKNKDKAYPFEADDMEQFINSISGIQDKRLF